MEYKFSEELRNCLIDYFKKNYNMPISHEQADEWLDSLASLLECFLINNACISDKKKIKQIDKILN